jgi:hypothetical protein
VDLYLFARVELGVAHSAVMLQVGGRPVKKERKKERMKNCNGLFCAQNGAAAAASAAAECRIAKA